MTTDGIVTAVVGSIGIIVAIIGIIIGTRNSKKIKLLMKHIGNIEAKDNSKVSVKDVKIGNIETHEKSGDI